MRVFVILSFVAVACANQSGYNYQPVGHGSDGIPSFATPQGVADYADGSKTVPNYGVPQDYFSQPSHNDAAYAPQAELDKEFFTYNAKEDDFNYPAASDNLSNAVKQGIRVIFIKGPENKGLEDAALALAKQASEQKTAIYVLNKQADLGNLANKLNNINKNSNNKPEVHFVKYRTPEDAANAQKAIQGQYDSLGGHSQSHDGGIAPVLNFASKAPVAAQGAATSPVLSYIPPATVPFAFGPSASYLPASILRRL